MLVRYRWEKKEQTEADDKQETIDHIYNWPFPVDAGANIEYTLVQKSNLTLIAVWIFHINNKYKLTNCISK